MAVAMGERHTHLHDARLVAVQPLVIARVRELAILAGEREFEGVFDGMVCALFAESLRAIGADEGTIWLLDEQGTSLVPHFNSGPRAATFVRKFRQNLSAGMISMVVATEQPICENRVHQNQQQDKRLDRELGLKTCAMLAIPLYFGGGLRGVITAVQVQAVSSPDPEPPGFSARNLQAFQLTASVISRLVDQQLYTLALGVEAFA